MSNESKYKVNGEGWGETPHLYRVLIPNNYEYFIKKLDAENIAGSDFTIEQRYTDLQIELLQKDDGWIVADRSLNCPLTTMIDLKLPNGSLMTSIAKSVSVHDRSNCIAYRLTTNDHYINGKRVVLQEGDWVDIYTDEMGRRSAINKIKECDLAYVETMKTIVVGEFTQTIKRKLTLAQALNAENAKDAAVSEQCEYLHQGKPFTDKDAWKDVTQDHENDSPDELEIFAHSARWDYKNGEMPPVGMVCEVSDCGGEWEKVTIKYLGEDIIVYAQKINGKEWEGAQHPSEVSLVFRPIQTPKERVIEKAIKAMNKIDKSLTDSRQKVYAEALYDAGMLIEGSK